MVVFLVLLIVYVAWLLLLVLFIVPVLLLQGVGHTRGSILRTLNCSLSLSVLCFCVITCGGIFRPVTCFRNLEIVIPVMVFLGLVSRLLG